MGEEVSFTYEALRPYRLSGAASRPIAGRLRVIDRRFTDDADWWAWRGISDFAAPAYVLRGRERELVERLDVYMRAGRTIVRMFGMLGAPIWQQRGVAFSPRDAGYWDAIDRAVALANARDLRVNLCAFADAQIVVPDANERRRWLRQFAEYVSATPGAVLQIANEPAFNGWSEADDPGLVELATIAVEILGHRDLSIGDPLDGDDPEASAQTVERLITLSRLANIGVLHSSRKEDPSRYRRWVDHLEGIVDVMPQLAPGTTIVHDEPMGAGPFQPEKRDDDPDAFVGAEFTAACCELGYTYHWIPEEAAEGGLRVHQLPGLEALGTILHDVPASPDWTYRNDSWAGAPTDGITWIGRPGKVRNLVRGMQAWTVAYGEADFDSVQWRPGWTPREIYAGPRVRVWAVNQ